MEGIGKQHTAREIQEPIETFSHPSVEEGKEIVMVWASVWY